MATRNTISRITTRIDELAERLAPSRGPIMIFRTLGEDPTLRAAQIDRSGQRPVIVINTGIDRSDPDPAFCTRESVAAALPKAKAMIAGQRELATRDTHNDFGGFAERMEEHWLALCRRFDIDYGVPGAAQ
jgi:hypothetical protein